VRNISRLLLILSFVWAITLLALGGWWLYLLYSFGAQLDQLKLALGDGYIGINQGPNLGKLILWEGTTFLLILSLLSASMLFLYLKDQKKTKSLQDFFASLTHELKTPLASMRLQAEVIEGLAVQGPSRIQELSARMVEDVVKLETQMDKILQLSRLERGGRMNLTQVDLNSFTKSIAKQFAGNLSLSLQAQAELPEILADEFALTLIFKNLFENTKNHVDENQQIQISLAHNSPWVALTYCDHGKFEGQKDRLGTMFYKHASTKGTGIGLYLIKKSLEAMGGSFKITSENPFTLELNFLVHEEGQHE
jgi:signal transduction histidine kinase